MKKNQELLWKKQGIKIHPKIRIIGQVYITDYNYVKNADGNRPFTTGLKHLSDSINNYGLCSTPLAVKEKGKYVIVDGWHRKHIMDKKLGIPMIITLVEPTCTINELMITLNTTQVNWSPEAYLNNGITYHKNPDYTFLSEMNEDTSISVTALYEIYAYDIPRSEAKQRFEKGSWKASTKALGNSIVNITEEIEKYVSFSRNVNFIKGFAMCVSNPLFDKEQLIAQLKRFKRKVHDCDKPRQHADMINTIYNHLVQPEQKQYLI
tara:strand:- start:251 stop:1042 length:792 start_codon:yes stop_codon:yes gene_type:complete